VTCGQLVCRDHLAHKVWLEFLAHQVSQDPEVFRVRMESPDRLEISALRVLKELPERLVRMADSYRRCDIFLVTRVWGCPPICVLVLWVRLSVNSYSSIKFSNSFQGDLCWISLIQSEDHHSFRPKFRKNKNFLGVTRTSLLFTCHCQWGTFVPPDAGSAVNPLCFPMLT